MGTRVALAFGSNLGADPRQNILDAVDALKASGLQHVQLAPFLVTAPVDCVPGTPDFTNTALVGDWAGTPHELLELTQRLEQTAGRPKRHSSHEARILDIDIILFGDRIISTPDLTVPHPRMHQRLFVLEPLSVLMPEWIIPTLGTSIQQQKDHLLAIAKTNVQKM